MKNCSYCGSTRNIVNDHIIAEIKGGSETVPACEACNLSKGSKAPMEWLRWLKKNDQYRWRNIVNYNNGKKNKIAKKVHIVRDEK